MGDKVTVAALEARLGVGTWLDNVPRHVAIRNAARVLEVTSSLTQAHFASADKYTSNFWVEWRPMWWWRQVVELLPLYVAAAGGGEAAAAAGGARHVAAHGRYPRLLHAEWPVLGH